MAAAPGEALAAVAEGDHDAGGRVPIGTASVTRHEEPTTEAGADSARALLRRITTMWRNASIYAPEHPRVQGAVTAVLGHFGYVASGDRTVLVRDGKLLLCGATFDLDDDEVAVLVARLREVGLRGLELTPEATANDLVEFLQMARRQRHRGASELVARWPADHARLRALPLVFEGDFQGDGSHGKPAPGGATTKARLAARAPASPPPLPPAVRSALQQLVADEETQARLAAMAAMTTAEGERTTTLPLLERLGQLLPADVGNDATAIAATVRTILARIERDLGEVVRRGARVRGSDLMRQALTLARTVFGTSSTPAQSGDALPSGRPEDEAITADVDLLLGEFEQLPDEERSFPPEIGAEHDFATAREQFGICLYLVARDRRTGGSAGARRRVAQLLSRHGETLRSEWEPYLAVDGSSKGRDAERRAVLQAMLDANVDALQPLRPHLDAAFFAATFPDSLAGCVRALGGDDAGRTVLRQGLQLVGPMLLLGGVAAAERCGCLADERVVATLLELNTPEVRELLPAMARQANAGSLQRLRQFVLGLDLAPGVRAVLESAPDAAGLPPTFLARLLAAWTKQRATPTLVGECAELLLATAQQFLANHDTAGLLAAIPRLVHSPLPETRALLAQLAKRGRWTRWDRTSRAIRQCARQALTTLQEAP
jgi:hypothetical protein